MDCRLRLAMRQGLWCVRLARPTDRRYQPQRHASAVICCCMRASRCVLLDHAQRHTQRSTGRRRETRSCDRERSRANTPRTCAILVRFNSSRYLFARRFFATRFCFKSPRWTRTPIARWCTGQGQWPTSCTVSRTRSTRGTMQHRCVHLCGSRTPSQRSRLPSLYRTKRRPLMPHTAASLGAERRDSPRAACQNTR